MKPTFLLAQMRESPRKGKGRKNSIESKAEMEKITLTDSLTSQEHFCLH